MKTEWRIPFGPLPGKAFWLVSEHYLCDQGFGHRPLILPVTVTQARYRGEYEGAPWLCFPCAPEMMSVTSGPWGDWASPDNEACRIFWHTADCEAWPVGRGQDPTAAYDDLIRIGLQRAGLTIGDVLVEPFWPPGKG